MSVIIPLAYLCAVSVVWTLTAIENHRLLKLFIARLRPDQRDAVPSALFYRGRHPEKLFFFFRRGAIPMLRSDSAVWERRQRLKFLLWLSLGVWVGGFVVAALATYVLSLQATAASYGVGS